MATPRKTGPHLKRGRKSKYRPHYPEMLLEHMRKGYNFKSFGAVTDPLASEATLWRWIDMHPEFREARKLGAGLLEKWGIDSSKAMAMGNITVVTKTTPVIDARGKPVMDPKRPGHVLVIEEREPAKVNAAVHIFLLKNMLHWRDKHDIQIAGTPGGAAIKTETRQLTSEERQKEIERLRRVRENGGGD